MWVRYEWDFIRHSDLLQLSRLYPEILKYFNNIIKLCNGRFYFSFQDSPDMFLCIEHKVDIESVPRPSFLLSAIEKKIPDMIETNKELDFLCACSMVAMRCNNNDIVEERLVHILMNCLGYTYYAEALFYLNRAKEILGAIYATNK
jgi:hypothetical protein